MVEGSRLLSGCGGKTSPRVRIPASPPVTTVKDERLKKFKTIVKVLNKLIKNITFCHSREGGNPFKIEDLHLHRKSGFLLPQE